MAVICELCNTQGGRVLWKDNLCRVVLVDDDGYPGYCRVIWNDHIKEMTELAAEGRRHFMDVVFAVEVCVRDVLAPEKINLASLGNVTPHLHWHVIPRFRSDPHFPNTIWGIKQRDEQCNITGPLVEQLCNRVAGLVLTAQR